MPRSQPETDAPGTALWHRVCATPLSALKGAVCHRVSGPHQFYDGRSFNGRLRDELLNLEIFDTLYEGQVLTEQWRLPTCFFRGE